MESLVMKSLNRTVDVNTNIIQLDGCLPFLGCTILLSGQDMNELKLVKHALKKILRLSRQLILESEYYQFLDLSHCSPTVPEQKENAMKATKHNPTPRLKDQSKIHRSCTISIWRETS